MADSAPPATDGPPRDAVTGMWPAPDARAAPGEGGGETIVAAATAPGRAGIGIVRISGPLASSIAVEMTGRIPEPRHATLARFVDGAGEVIDAGLVLYFGGPASFTGEDVLELHGHGGPVVMDMLVRRVIELGARLARPGEFTERAFLNDKVDLTQAEAVADLIEAGSAQAARAAMRSLQGEFSQEVCGLVDALTALRVYVEAAIDFPDDDIEILASPDIGVRLADIEERLARIEGAAARGCLLRDGLNAVIAGKPNAGKSSLLNALAGYDAAIVTPIPGTTRDVLRERIHVDGLPVHVIDTAGLRDTVDLVEGEGVRRARGEMERAGLVLYVVDAAEPPSEAALAAELATLPGGVPVLQVWNKADLLPVGADPVAGSAAAALLISATTGLGLHALRERIKAQAGYEQAGGGAWSARTRHLEALQKASAAITRARQEMLERAAFELAAEELRLAQQALGEITGEVTSDELLGRVFSSFCIGK